MRIFLFCLASMSFPLQLFGKINQAGLRLWNTRPAAKWLEALTIGNGSLEGMIYEGSAQEHFQFNEESLITGTTKTIGYFQPFGDTHQAVVTISQNKF